MGFHARYYFEKQTATEQQYEADTDVLQKLTAVHWLI